MKPVVVCGGGLAGLAAATVLAEADRRVIVLERESHLGGRAGAWTDRLRDGTPFEMERGFHAFFRNYHNLRGLMRRVDPTLSSLRAQDDYPVLTPHESASFRDLSTRTPINLIQLVRRTKSLDLRALMHVDALRASAMLAYGPHTYARWDDVSAKDYLDSLRFPREARSLLFDVFAHSFFNDEARLSAAELLMQFHFYFTGNPQGLVFDTMQVPFSRGLFEPLRAYLEDRGTEVRLDTKVLGIDSRRVVLEGETIEHAGVVAALNVPGLRAVAARSELGPQTRRSIESLDVAPPFVVWRLWLDRRVPRAPFAGTSGVGLLDNVSIYDALEDESARWARRTGGSVVELHAYAIDPALDDGRVRADLLDGLHRLYPETRDAMILEERYLRRRDCPSFAPGSHALRPRVETDTPNLVLAGDFVRLDAPSALMERAVASGFHAANALLGLEAQPVHAPSKRGLLARARF